ncbi:HK97 family phage prohead protease [Cryptosporangium sp. NPDC051539]|uniref:HK97 family phage prohead protease n=1 Tax=Cryptosporangium sp. NPDC051539 TaxID=3363962 RepID=UPI00379F3A41
MAAKSDRGAAKPEARSTRAYPVQLEVRAKAGGVSTLTGYASVTEAPYEMWDWLGPYTETVRAGAFAKTLQENPGVQLLLNHGGLSMAYTKAGTLRLSEDTTGLHMEADVNGKRRDVGDMLAAIEDLAVDEMSFAFRITRQRWSPDYEELAVEEVDLHRGDVSVVNFGANPSTSVESARSFDPGRLSDEAARDLLERLQRRFAPATHEPAGHDPALSRARLALLG